MMHRSVRILFLIAVLSLAVPQQSHAIDPVTIAILAPIALQAAQAARPYVVRGMINFGKGMLKVGKAMLGIFYLPYGLFKIIFLSPWGQFRSGVIYTIRGSFALGKVVVNILLLPVYMCGLEINFG